ncbi:coiled-coil protein [Salix suchowensis]|nr:coiled-coil protein [Salix suchowensis]
MASSSDGHHFADFSGPSNPFTSAGDLNFQLQTLLEAKKEQLNQAALFGQQILDQQKELHERIRQLQEVEGQKEEDDEVDPDSRIRYEQLAETIRVWDAQNAQFGNVSLVNGKDPSLDPPREEHERPKAGSSAAQSRRAKNAAHRADNVEFALEIGSGLLTEVRRLQSLLGERDKAIQDMKEEKDDLDKTLESFRTALRQQEQSAGTAQRLEGEHKRLTKLLATARDAGDQHKNEAERLNNTIEEMKAKHETDIAHARKHAASLARDKSDLQQTVDQMKTEAARSGRRLPRFGSPLTPNGAAGSDFLTPGGLDEDDVFSTGGASTNRRRMDNSAIYQGGVDEFGMPDDPRPSREVEELQQKLAHAQRQISSLTHRVKREKELKMDFKRQLMENSPGVAIIDDDEEDYEDEETVEAGPISPPGASLPIVGEPHVVVVFVVGAEEQPLQSVYDTLRTALRRLTAISQSPAPLRLPSPLYPVISKALLRIYSMIIQNSEKRNSSVDGMDPQFANVLKRTPSTSSIPANGSPLRRSTLVRSVRGGTVGRRQRGGKAYSEARPESLVGQPEDLLQALATGASPLKDNSIVEEVLGEFDVEAESDSEPVKEMVEFACQTEPEVEEPKVVEPVKAMAEIGIQSERTEMAIQHDAPVEVKPILASMGINTEPEPTPFVPVLVPAETQTPSASTFDMEIQTMPPAKPGSARRATVVQADFSPSASYEASDLSGDSTLTGRTARLFLAAQPEGYDDLDEGEETETGAETETEPEGYHSAIMSTPSVSQDDFHSMMTLTDVDGVSDSDDDGDSIVVSRLGGRSSAGTPADMSSMAQTPEPTVTYEEKAIETDVVEEPVVTVVAEPVIVPIPDPEPVVEEVKVEEPRSRRQTSGFPPHPHPTAPAPLPVPTSPSFALYRVGSAGQQFQFVPPSSASSTAPSRSGTPSLISSPVPVLASLQRESSVPFATHSVHPPPTADNYPATNRHGPAIIHPREAQATYDVPPPRPSSPPPPELIQRATTPTFGSVLNVPGRPKQILRQHGSMPAPQDGLRQPPSTSSFRSAANAAAHAAQTAAASMGLMNASAIKDRERREFSQTSLISASPDLPSHPIICSPTSRKDRMHLAVGGASTDPTIIHAITQTMIGEFMYKYTRKRSARDMDKQDIVAFSGYILHEDFSTKPKKLAEYRPGETWNTTPRGKRSRSQLSVGGSIGKRSGTPAAEYLRWNGPESPYSPTKSFEHIGAQDDEELDLNCTVILVLMMGSRVWKMFARAAMADIPEPARPASPAWSFRSRAGSTNSHEGGGGIFSWGRGEDGKLRFGSRRSKKYLRTIHNACPISTGCFGVSRYRIVYARSNLRL